MIEELWAGTTGGRHALDEDAVQTPIFHALTRGGWRRRQQERTTTAVEEFRRDPLTAPIPIQVDVPAPSDGSARAERPAGGRDGSGRAERPAAAARDWSGSAREWSREWSAALAGRGRHHREPVPAHW